MNVTDISDIVNPTVFAHIVKFGNSGFEAISSSAGKHFKFVLSEIPGGFKIKIPNAGRKMNTYDLQEAYAVRRAVEERMGKSYTISWHDEVQSASEFFFKVLESESISESSRNLYNN